MLGQKIILAFPGERYADPPSASTLPPGLSKVAYTVLGLTNFSTTFSILPDFDDINFEYVSEDYNKMNKFPLENIFTRKKMTTYYFLHFF